MQEPTPEAPAEHDLTIPETRAGASLERRLPLMISALLVVTIAAFGFLAFSEVRQSSIAAATGQLRTIIGQTGDAASRTLTQRALALETLSEAPVVAQAVSATASRTQQEAAAAFLRSRRVPSDTVTFASELLVDALGRRVLVAGRVPDTADIEELQAALANTSARDSATLGVPYTTDNAMWYWAVVRVRTDSGPGGYIAEQRRIRANPSVAQQLKGFTGQDISMYYAAAGAKVWTGLGGVPFPPKFDITAAADSFRVISESGEALIGVKSQLQGTPWYIVFAISESAVEARALAFLTRMLGVAALLLIVAIFAAWLVSRRVTRPLKSLTVAARKIAQGDFEAREPVRTNDEIGELTRAFNVMAERVGESHALLGLRIEESEALAAQLHRASKAKSEFLAMMSHELRTPLSAIAGYAEILQLGMRGQLNAAQQLDLSRIQANQVHLLRIINDILDLAQVESGQLQLSTQPVALRDVMNDLEPIVLPLIAVKGLQFTVSEQLLQISVVAERDRLTQVLVNLVANAVRFTEQDGTISIHGTLTDSELKLHVTDSGIGIAPEKHEAIFQPFVQADSGTSRRAQGTGLGLAISRRIAEAMGGTLTVCSAPGSGATFTMRLMRAVMHDATGTATQPGELAREFPAREADAPIRAFATVSR